jgi:hypothetical protein
MGSIPFAEPFSLGGPCRDFRITSFPKLCTVPLVGRVRVVAIETAVPPFGLNTDREACIATDLPSEISTCST